MHVPQRYRDRIQNAMTIDKAIAVKIDLTSPDGEDVLHLTPGQVLKLDNARNQGKKVITIPMSRKQVKANVKSGGFLSALLALAKSALPALLGGLATGVISGAVDKAVSGRGLYLSKRGRGTARVHISGEGIILTQAEDDPGYNGLYLKHDGRVFQGEGLLLGPRSPFKDVPLLGLIL